MDASDGRDCPMRPDDELACLRYPTLTELPESSAPGSMHRPPQKKSHWKLWLLLLAVITAAGLMILQRQRKPVPPVQTIPVTAESALPVQTVPATAELAPSVQTVPMTTEAPAVPVYPFPDLVLRNIGHDRTSEYAFGTEIRKEDVISITFLDSLEAAPQDAVDVSETGNGKVLLWAERGRVSIAGDGKVFFPANSRKLFGSTYGFYQYGDLQKIDFHDAVDTSCVTNMGGMFSNCTSLISLDLRGFDTSDVTDMDRMFFGCSSLDSLDLRGFDTGNVTDMKWMFFGCSSLDSLNLSGFDVGNVEDMLNMFGKCSGLTHLDLSGFDTSHVTDMDGMFWDCGPNLNLITDDSRLLDQFHEDIA